MKRILDVRVLSSLWLVAFASAGAGGAAAGAVSPTGDVATSASLRKEETPPQPQQPQQQQQQQQQQQPRQFQRRLDPISAGTFDYDCLKCLNASDTTDFFWCPGDATCYDTPFEEAVNPNVTIFPFLDPLRFSECPQAEDYTQDESACTDGLLPDGSSAPFGWNDPLYPAQEWIFDMIHMQEVWSGTWPLNRSYFGNGTTEAGVDPIKVRINDEGIFQDHPEIAGKIVFPDSITSETTIDPTEQELLNNRPPDLFSHGTAVASILAAEPNNGICGVGVAPGLQLSHSRYTVSKYLGLKPTGAKMHVTVNPYANTLVGCTPFFGGIDTSGSANKGQGNGPPSQRRATRRRRRRHRGRKLQDSFTGQERRLETVEEEMRRIRRILASHGLVWRNGDGTQYDHYNQPENGPTEESPLGPVDGDDTAAGPSSSTSSSLVRRNLKGDSDSGKSKGKSKKDKGDGKSKGKSKKDKGDCPFTWTASRTYPCDEPSCDFSCTDCEPSSINDNCTAAIVFHCQQHAIRDSDACFGLSEFLVPNECKFDTYRSSALDAESFGIDRTVTEEVNGAPRGRNGLGAVHVFSAGNFLGFGSDLNHIFYANTRLAITVGAVGKTEENAYYATGGASMFVTAPGGDLQKAVTNFPVANLLTASGEGTCTDAGEGTSWSAPVVAGCVALILETRNNLELTWRDVQGIIAQTSRPNFDEFDTTAHRNAANFWHSHFAGFGIIQCFEALVAAEDWVVWPDEQYIELTSGELNEVIPDNVNAPIKASLAYDPPVPIPLFVETVYVWFDFNHTSRGHLEIVLLSPEGTESELTPGERPESVQLPDGQYFRTTTRRNWGESPLGEWKVTIRDNKLGDVSEDCIDTKSDCRTNPLDRTQTDCSAPNFNEAAFTNDCLTIELLGYCADGDVIDVAIPPADLATIENDFAPFCCACGGGIFGDALDAIPETLDKYKMEIYAHEEPNVCEYNRNDEYISVCWADKGKFKSICEKRDKVLKEERKQIEDKYSGRRHQNIFFDNRQRERQRRLSSSNDKINFDGPVHRGCCDPAKIIRIVGLAIGDETLSAEDLDIQEPDFSCSPPLFQLGAQEEFDTWIEIVEAEMIYNLTLYCNLDVTDGSQSSSGKKKKKENKKESKKENKKENKKNDKSGRLGFKACVTEIAAPTNQESVCIDPFGSLDLNLFSFEVKEGCDIAL